MQIKYSAEVDILYIKLKDTPPVESEHLVEENLILDYDENDEIVGIEILDWSKRKEATLPLTGKFYLAFQSS